MALGKSIRIYLDGGDVTGIRYAELVNWTGQAILFPRNRLAELTGWSDTLDRPGVYFLMGTEKALRREAYIGESESVAARLQQHIAKEFWQEAIVFTSKDENLTKSHIKYLESRLIELASSAKRYDLQNSNQPNRPSLPRPDCDAMEEFLSHLRLLLGALGHRLLEPLIDPAAPSVDATTAAGTLTFTVKAAVAHAVITDEGLVVLKDSTALPQMNASMDNYKVQRIDLLERGLLLAEGDLLRFKEDVLFTSPSAAATVISGSAVNGRTAWRDAQGRSLKDLEEAPAKT